MKKSTPIYFSTYARAIISELNSLALLIRKYSTVVAESGLTPSEMPNILTLEQIEQALLNPQNAIKPSMAAYATLIKSRRHIGSLQEQSRNQRAFLQEGIRKLQIKLGEAKDEQEKTSISEAITEMENAYKELVEAYKGLLAYAAKVIELEHKVVKLIKQYDEEWEQYRSFFLQELVNQIEALDVPLSELERQDFLRDEPWAEVVSRFELANIEIPEALHLETPQYTTYFKLKAYWAMHSSLSRRMLPNKSENVLKLLKKLPL